MKQAGSWTAWVGTGQDRTGQRNGAETGRDETGRELDGWGWDRDGDKPRTETGTETLRRTGNGKWGTGNGERGTGRHSDCSRRQECQPRYTATTPMVWPARGARPVDSAVLTTHQTPWPAAERETASRRPSVRGGGGGRKHTTPATEVVSKKGSDKPK